MALQRKSFPSTIYSILTVEEAEALVNREAMTGNEAKIFG